MAKTGCKPAGVKTLLYGSYRHLISCGKMPCKVTVAIARELTGFIWSVFREYQARRSVKNAVWWIYFFISPPPKLFSWYLKMRNKDETNRCGHDRSNMRASYAIDSERCWIRDSRRQKLPTKIINVGSGLVIRLIHEYQSDSSSKPPAPWRVTKKM